MSKDKSPPSAEQAFENNKAEALVYPGPAQGLANGGTVKSKSSAVPRARGGWKRWGSK